MIANVSRKDLNLFQQWIKTLPWQDVRFLYQTYEAEPTRQQKTLELYQRFLKEKFQTPQSGRTTPTTTPPNTTTH